MTNFYIIMHKGFRDSYVIVEPSPHVIEVAQYLSTMPGVDWVSVSMFARSRWMFKDGEMIQSNPNLSVFYKDVDAEDQWSWSCLGQCND